MEDTVLKVVMFTANNEMQKTIELKRPEENLSLSDVQTAFATFLTNGWLLADDGTTLSSVSEAYYITTTPLA